MSWCHLGELPECLIEDGWLNLMARSATGVLCSLTQPQTRPGDGCLNQPSSPHTPTQSILELCNVVIVPMRHVKS